MKLKAPDIPGLRQVSDETIYGHVFSNADREVGGVLVGRVPRDGSLPLVSGAIAALKADEQRATLTFTQDAWEHVHRTLDEEYPEGEQIVGWYHSHPGFGIFLSEHDLFIHRNFFSGASQIAVVVDPHAQTEGVFVWRDGQVELLVERPTPPGWVAEGIEPAAARGRTRVTATAAAPRSEPYPWLPLLVAAVVGILAGLGGWSLVAGSDEPPAQQPQPQPVVPRITTPGKANSKAARQQPGVPTQPQGDLSDNSRNNEACKRVTPGSTHVTPDGTQITRPADGGDCLTKVR